MCVTCVGVHLGERRLRVRNEGLFDFAQSSVAKDEGVVYTASEGRWPRGCVFMQLV